MAAAGGGASDYANCIVTVDPSTFEAGDIVTVTGSGLEPNFDTTIEFSGVQVGTALTDATGAFEAQVTIPSDATDGPHTITAVCDTPGNVSSTDVTVSSTGQVPTTAPGGGPLPRTGNDTEPLVVAGGIAVLAGVAFVLVAKRRRRTASH
ncbi:MAG: LPXTG cell wall anchor domain-containing protein [Acidimicrobiales bacterium]